MGLKVSAGRPEPLGVSIDGNGINAALASTSAEAVFLSLFDDADRESARIKLPARTGDVFHGHIHGVGVGAGARYGFRAQGAFDPTRGHRFNPAKLLVDPFATRLDRPFSLHPALFDARIQGAASDEIDSAPFAPKAIVEAPAPLMPPRRPDVAWRDLVIYEMHVRGFTRLREDIPEAIRGTFQALGHPASLGHLTRLGITAVELLPAAAFVDERHLPPLGLSNYWGYNPVALLAPDPRLAPGGFAEVRGAVDALHGAGIAVILDVVLNHTGESDEFGPTLSLRGLDNAGFYRLRPGDPTRYVNDSGCGNVLALERPLGLRLALDALRIWATRAGIDGFRYDLAATLARRENGFDQEHPLLAAIAQDPCLRELIHIAEPWDLGPGGYRLGAFPTAWGEWNDQSRDIFRRYWRGDERLTGALATRLAGSADIFAERRRPLSRSINFVTAHDGFTLKDLVSYTAKRNEANGEGNRDGADENLSWNCGAEGESRDPAVAARRAGDIRALLATLIAARGTPMLTMGDELGRSQGGNNNVYAQDNALAWIDWASADADLTDFTARLIHLRRSTGALNGEAALTGAPIDASGFADVEWLTAEGAPYAVADWEEPGAKPLIAVFYDPGEGLRAPSRAAVLLNRDGAAIEVRCPPLRDGHGWSIEIDSAHPARAAEITVEDRIALAGRSVAILVERPVPREARRQTGAADDVLDALAEAAGIALEWFDVDGGRHLVGTETKRALLASLDLAASTTGEARARLAELAEERALRPLPVASTIRLGGDSALRLGGPLANLERKFALSIALEDGSTRQIEIASDAGRRCAIAAADGRQALVRHVPLPDLPLGRHTIVSDAAPDRPAHLAIVPAAAFLPPLLRDGPPVFGVSAQLYGLRRGPGDQGIGDFTTLRLYAEEAAREGASLVGLNPLHALFPSDPERASPYHPSDRRFLDPLAIDAFDLPEPLLSLGVRTEIERAGPEAARLAAKRLVDYRAVAALKNPLFDAAHAAFAELSLARPDHPLVADHAAFVRAGGQMLWRFAIFSAIEAHFGATLGQFPKALKAPDGVGIAAFARTHEEPIARAIFLQWLADRQLASAACAARAAGLRLGFYRDLAVGCAPDGAEAFAEADKLMRGVSIGAPPDPLGPNGQVWGLPPYDPRALARDGFAGFAQLIASNMAHAGVLRIDHVLGLKRLFLVPDGMQGAEGAYLACPFEDLLGQVMLESVRAGAAVVGEDLGTVPDGIRARLAHARILSYKVMRFEREESGFLAPERYPRLAAACLATHDLPPLAGWWLGADIAEADGLGLLADAACAAATRRAEKSELVGAIGGTADLEAALEAPLSADLAAAAHGYVARSNAVLVLVQADDLALETVPVNLPGTDRERPNWRRKISEPVESLFSLPSARTILEEVSRRRPGPADESSEPGGAAQIER
ncbi:glycogen debranching protein GlgX [Methylocapsa aurea]|uniref:glycogen debranching protein GlgX n=1 Tax=Methylocapsa aurea TaxID=663610 RepID=UPI00068F2627|nr:glycogen debranching protein GlgX [Methylocapsa aurea]